MDEVIFIICKYACLAVCACLIEQMALMREMDEGNARFRVHNPRSRKNKRKKK